MPVIVQVKGVGNVEFPDNTPKETILDALRRNFANAGKSIVGGAEALGSIASSAFAEPASGYAGIAGAIAPGEQGQGAQWVKNTQDALTYQPRTDEGRRYLESVGKALQPVGDSISGASKKLGDKAYDTTGSPLAASAAYSIPTALLEGLGVKGLKVKANPNVHVARSGVGDVPTTPANKNTILSTPVDWGGQFKGERLSLDGGHIDIVSANNGLTDKTIMEFFTNEQSRGKGIGGKLLDEAVKKYGFDLGAQFSSKESVAAAYNRGFRAKGEYAGATKEELMNEAAGGNSVFMQFTDGVDSERVYKPKDKTPEPELKNSVTLPSGAAGAEAFRAIKKGNPSARVTSRNADGTITVSY